MRKLFATALALASAAAFWMVPASASAASCTAQIGDGCGAYSWSGWPGSNGFNTYVVDQDVGAQHGDTGSITADSPSSWTAQGNYVSCGGCVQTYTAVQQLMNNWGSGGFNGSDDVPVAHLGKLQVTYTENAPTTAGNQYEFSPDIWTNYAGQAGSGSGDIMMWGDTSHGRCVNNGLNASNIIGQATMSKQHWTVYRYGGPGVEIVFILDGTSSTDPVDTGTCATQKSGTFHVLSALKWLANHHVALFPSLANLTVGQMNAGWEITDMNGGGYAVTRLAYPVSFK